MKNYNVSQKIDHLLQFCSLDKLDRKGNSLLYNAISLGNVQLCELLFKKHNSFPNYNFHGQKSIIELLARGLTSKSKANYLQILKLLRKYNIKFNQPIVNAPQFIRNCNMLFSDELQLLIKFVRVQTKSWEILQTFLDNSHDVKLNTFRPPKKSSNIITASWNTILKILFNFCDIHMKDNDNNPPIYYALFFGDLLLCKLLLEQDTSLIYAIPSSFKLLLQGLKSPAKNNYIKIITLLKENEIILHYTPKDLHFFKRQHETLHSYEIHELLTITYHSSLYDTLHAALKPKNFTFHNPSNLNSCFNLLRYTNPNIENAKGWTLTDCCVINYGNHPQLISYLFDHKVNNKWVVARYTLSEALYKLILVKNSLEFIMPKTSKMQKAFEEKLFKNIDLVSQLPLITYNPSPRTFTKTYNKSTSLLHVIIQTKHNFDYIWNHYSFCCTLVDSNNNIPLHYLASNADTAIAKKLIQHMKNLNVGTLNKIWLYKNAQKITPFFLFLTSNLKISSKWALIENLLENNNKTISCKLTKFLRQNTKYLQIRGYTYFLHNLPLENYINTTRIFTKLLNINLLDSKNRTVLEAFIYRICTSQGRLHYNYGPIIQVLKILLPYSTITIYKPFLTSNGRITSMINYIQGCNKLPIPIKHQIVGLLLQEGALPIGLGNKMTKNLNSRPTENTNFLLHTNGIAEHFQLKLSLFLEKMFLDINYIKMKVRPIWNIIITTKARSSLVKNLILPEISFYILNNYVYRAINEEYQALDQMVRNSNDSEKVKQEYSTKIIQSFLQIYKKIEFDYSGLVRIIINTCEEHKLKLLSSTPSHRAVLPQHSRLSSVSTSPSQIDKFP